MEKIKAIIVDDEESARDVLENLLRRFCPEVEITNKFSNVMQAVESCKRNAPDLVFLDIEMPNYAGFEIVNFFDSIPFEIIFVTAYDKYALRAFEIAAIDYLLKPVDIDRLKEAVSKVKKITGLKENSERLSLLSQTLQSKEVKSIMVTDKGYQQVVAVDSIIAIEAEESYCTIHTTEKKYTVSKNLKHFETVFADNPMFFRVHKSWMISKKHILNYSKSELLINLSNGLTARLSKYKKAEFEEAIIA
ncbi:MAG TPA: LytTR family DNA-binding domain-containing protein [Bacteroidia bacterium]|nr:LytTR family DNA-binding domain-containing protein [Bacteroidia bacterium]